MLLTKHLLEYTSKQPVLDVSNKETVGVKAKKALGSESESNYIVRLLVRRLLHRPGGRVGALYDDPS